MKLEKYEEEFLLKNSIERVINTSIRLVETVQAASRHPDQQELATTNLDDWQVLKELVAKLWNNARNDVLVSRSRG